LNSKNHDIFINANPGENISGFEKCRIPSGLFDYMTSHGTQEVVIIPKPEM